MTHVALSTTGHLWRDIIGKRRDVHCTPVLWFLWGILYTADMNHSNVTTALELPGKKIMTSLGLVKGITVRSRSIIGSLGGALQTIVGGNITLFTELCEKTRQDAYELMVRHAEELSANAIVSVRYDATEVMGGVTEVLCYGTAVVVE